MGDNPKKYHVTDDGDVYRINDDGSFTSMGNAEHMSTSNPKEADASSSDFSTNDRPIKPFSKKNRIGIAFGVITCVLLFGGIGLLYILNQPETSNIPIADTFSADTVVPSINAEPSGDIEKLNVEEQIVEVQKTHHVEEPNVKSYESRQREIVESQRESENLSIPTEHSADKANKKDAIDTNKIYSAVEVQADFPGGDRARRQWLRDNIQWPVDANGQQLHGEVELEFVIERDGAISNVKVTFSENPELNSAAINLISSMPKWSPAMVKNQPVRSPMGITLFF